MKRRMRLRLLINGVMTMTLILSTVSPAFAAGNYYQDDIVWSKSECSSGSRRIWQMNDDGTGQTLMTQYSPSGKTDEHPVYSDDGSEIVFARNNRIYKMNSATGEAGGLTKLAKSYYANHPFVFGSKVYYNKKNAGGVREIWRMNLSNGSSKEVVLSSSTTNTAENKYHPTVATYSGKDYLVYIEGDVKVDLDNKVQIYNLTDSIGPVTLADGSNLDTSAVIPPKDIYAPSITPDGTAVLLSQTGLLLGDPPPPIPPVPLPTLRVWKIDLNGTPMNNADDTKTDLTDDNGWFDVTPYADYPGSGEINFARSYYLGTDSEIFHKTGLGGTVPAPTNLTNDGSNIDVIVVEKSACNSPDPILCPSGADTTKSTATGFLAMTIGSLMLVWQRRRKSIKLV